MNDEAITMEEMTEEELRAAQREEALVRLETLERMGMHPNVRAEFEADGTVNYSERQNLGFGAMGILYWMENDTARSRSGKAFSALVREFEEAFGALVYHATHELTGFGEIIDLFYVSRDVGEWEDDRELLGEKRAYVKACNLDDDMMSDIGVICFEVSGGGLVRTA